MITTANTDDRLPLKTDHFEKLINDYEMSINFFKQIKDKIMLRKRTMIETINDQLKNIAQIEHSRQGSFGNFITNLIAGLIVYSFQEKKQSIKFETEKSTQLTLFY